MHSCMYISKYYMTCRTHDVCTIYYYIRCECIKVNLCVTIYAYTIGNRCSRDVKRTRDW